jgi:drug/metabolite transporter (DMT)-like permease
VKTPWPFQRSTLYWLSGLVIVSTIFPFAVYTLAVHWFQVWVAGILGMLEIPFAALYSFLFLNEKFTLIQYLVAMAVIECIVLLNLGMRGHSAPDCEQAKRPQGEKK